MDNAQSPDPRVLILEAEATPIFNHQHKRALDMLAVASQLDPDALAASWVARLALRMSEALLMQQEVDRATTWHKIAQEKAQAAQDTSLQHRAQVLNVRLMLVSGDIPQAEGRLRNLREQWASEQPEVTDISKLDLANAELHFLKGEYRAISTILNPRLAQEDAFASLDDLWRALSLCARGHQMSLEFEHAHIHFSRMADMANLHEASAEEAEARLGLGQALLGVTRFEEGVAEIKKAVAGAKGTLWQTAMGLLTTATLTTDNVDAALDIAKQAAIQAAKDDDYKTYINITGVVTGLYRIEKRHKDAYRDLVGIYGILKAKFGDQAAKPIKDQIGLLREDLGEKEFERISAELLAERKRKK